jgi:hypothetical protein
MLGNTFRTWGTYWELDGCIWFVLGWCEKKETYGTCQKERIISEE